MNWKSMLVILATATTGWAPTGGAQELSGTITDPGDHALRNAHVRLGMMAPGQAPKAGLVSVMTDVAGAYAATAPAMSGVLIGIGKAGYLNVVGVLQSLPPNLDLALEPLPLIDSPGYQWRPGFVDKNLATNANFGCNQCHGGQWEALKDSLHAKAATNEYMLSLYSGTGLDGTPGQAPGYKLDNPDKQGMCANCHVPLAAMDAPNAFDPRDATGVELEGVTCEVCHKVRHVEVNTKPGVAGAVQIWRPPPTYGLFAFGPYPDANSMPMKTSEQPQLRRAEFCSGCHEYSNEQGVPVMETYSEWTSVAGDDPDALHCQDCHMKRYDEHGDEDEPAEWDYILDDQHEQQMHGIMRDTREIFPHTFHGASEDYLQEVASVEISLIQAEGTLQVEALVENLYAGHALPTGMPFRNMLLVIEATVDGTPLEYVGEDVVPDYGGTWAGRPGAGFAKVLGDAKGTRNVDFWNATQVLEDTRLPALGELTAYYSFELPQTGGKVSVTATLVYRKFFEQLAAKKGWDVGEVIMTQEMAELQAETWVPEPDVEPPATDPDPGTDPPATDPGETDPDATAGAERDGCQAAPRGSPEAFALLLLMLMMLAFGRRRAQSE